MRPSQTRYLQQWQERIQDQEAAAHRRAAHARLLARDLESALARTRERLQHERTPPRALDGGEPASPDPHRGTLAAERIVQALSRATAPAVIVNPEGVILFANEAWRSVLYAGQRSDVGMDYFSIVGDNLAPSLQSRPGRPIQHLRAVMQGVRPAYRCEVTPPHATEVYLLDAAGLPGGGAVVMHTDITALNRHLAESERRALHDDLTGLLSHRAFHAQADQGLAAATRHGRAVHVLMIDLDDFKQVNDRFGHQAGDRVLIEVAARLQQAVREGDLVARLGGDEFAILAHEVHDPPGFRQRVLASLTEPLRYRGRQVTLTASIGMAAYPQDGGSIPALLQTADLRMYHHKRTRQASRET